MINVVYLVLVITTGKGVSIQNIPQANSKQCQVNSQFLNGTTYKNGENYITQYKTHCIVGVMSK